MYAAQPPTAYKLIGLVFGPKEDLFVTTVEDRILTYMDYWSDQVWLVLCSYIYTIRLNNLYSDTAGSIPVEQEEC